MSRLDHVSCHMICDSLDWFINVPFQENPNFDRVMLNWRRTGTEQEVLKYSSSQVSAAFPKSIS